MMVPRVDYRPHNRQNREKPTGRRPLRDGQSLNYVMATDRISGEVYRVSVKLTVVK